MRLSSFCFTYATLCVITGMCLGIWMGVSGDHTLGPVHAHLNVIGWLSVLGIGLYHRGSARAATRVDQVQVAMLATGIPAFVGGLGLYMTTMSPTLEAVVFPVALTGTLLCLASMVVFLVIVVTDARRDGQSDRRIFRQKLA